MGDTQRDGGQLESVLVTPPWETARASCFSFCCYPRIMDGCPKASEIQCMATLPDDCLMIGCLSFCWMWTVGIAVERVLVTGWETLRTSGRTLCAVQRQRSTVQCSWVAEHWEPEPPAASPQLHPASSSCASSELQLFPHFTLYKHTHTGRQ